jgi:hypothetical protein
MPKEQRAGNLHSGFCVVAAVWLHPHARQTHRTTLGHGSRARGEGDEAPQSVRRSVKDQGEVARTVRMTLFETPGTLARFRRTHWKLQQTFRTPLKTLQPFVEAIISAQKPLETGRVTIDQAVFEPKHVVALLAENSLPPKYGYDWTLEAANQDEIITLLQAVFSDWIDFLFVPTPRCFVIYADHDEYTTFYASQKSNFNRVVDALSNQGFDLIKNYERRLHPPH